MEKKPKYIIVYSCQTCNMESGYTELDTPLCRYCEKETPLTMAKFLNEKVAKLKKKTKSKSGQ